LDFVTPIKTGRGRGRTKCLGHYFKLRFGTNLSCKYGERATARASRLSTNSDFHFPCHFGTIRYLGFDQNWILTILQLPGLHLTFEAL